MNASDMIRVALAAQEYSGNVRLICSDGVEFVGPVLDVHPLYVTLQAKDGSPLAFALDDLKDAVAE